MDNLFLKGEQLIEELSSSGQKTLSLEYFEEVLTEIKDSYKSNQFMKIYKESLGKLSYAYTLVIYDFLEGQLTSDSSSSDKNGNETIVDVEIEES